MQRELQHGVWMQQESTLQTTYFQAFGEIRRRGVFLGCSVVPPGGPRAQGSEHSGHSQIVGDSQCCDSF